MMAESGRLAPPQRMLLLAAAGVLAAAALLLLLSANGSAVPTPYSSIVSAGPLDAVYVGQDLSCQVHRVSETQYQLFPAGPPPSPGVVPGDCGTFLLIDPVAGAPGSGTLWTPDFPNHGSGITATTCCITTPHFAFTFSAVSPVLGSGTAADPYRVTTTVTAGTTTIAEVDKYVVGNDFYTTDVQVTNTDPAPHTYRLYRAGDCYLQGSDQGFGYADGGPGSRVACTEFPNSLAGRQEMWIPHPAPGGIYSRFILDHYDTVWTRINDKLPFPDSCLCYGAPPCDGPTPPPPSSCRFDNGAGLSWDFSLPGGVAATFSHDTAFSPGPPPNSPPTATLQAGYSIASGPTCQDSSFLIQVLADDPDGTIASVVWDLGDATTASGSSVVHTYAAAGTYVLKVTVTDDKGAFVIVTGSIDSVGNPNCCPTIGTLTPVTIYEGQSIRITVIVDDWEGDALTLSLLNAPPGATIDPANRIVWYTPDQSTGDYTFQVKVSDGKTHTLGAPCQDTSTLTVHVLKRLGVGQAVDSDQDSVEDASDNCPSIPNQDQSDIDLDGLGDVCDLRPTEQDQLTVEQLQEPVQQRDFDHDGVPDIGDDCPLVVNAQQTDLDGDGQGDVCDTDLDGDGVPQTAPTGANLDNCPLVPNGDQADADKDGLGDACRTAAAAGPEGKGLGDASQLTAASGLSAPAAWMLGAMGAAVLAALVLVLVALRRRT